MIQKRQPNKLASTNVTNELADAINGIPVVDSGDVPIVRGNELSLLQITTAVSGEKGRFNAKLYKRGLKSNPTGTLAEADVTEFASAANAELWDLTAVNAEAALFAGYRSSGVPVFLRLAQRMIWVKITGNAAGVETYTGKSYMRDYSGDVSDSAGFSDSMLGTLASSDDCLILNVWSATDISDNILTADGTPTKPFLGEWRYTNSDGKKVVFIDGQDPESCV